MDKYLLSRVVMPEAKDIGYRDLFFRWSTTEVSSFGKKVNLLNEMYFNTWMNLFLAKKWFHYCSLENIFFGVEIKGTFSIEIIGSNRNVAHTRIDEKIFFSEFTSDGQPIFIPIKAAEKYDALFFVLRYEKSVSINFISAGWYTDVPPKTRNTLAIVTCTYKREDYINKTVDLFEGYLDKNPELQNRMHLFVIDNGQTLDLTKKYKYTEILYNINTGGAGGFARGLIEACKSEVTYTRCLFMDDDVEIIPESFFRTLVLSDYLKDSYTGAHINGAMLDYYHKEVFFENLAIQDGLWVHPYHGAANLYIYDEILRVSDIPEFVFHNKNQQVDGGWYYCCFPISKDKSINDLPLPIFIRGDDVEWGRRNYGNVCISMNGICIWHSSFYGRVSKVVDAYYLSRNMFIVNILYTDNFKDSFLKLYTDKFEYAIATYDYISAKLINKALDDILKGSALFMESPIDKMEELNILGAENSEKVLDEYELLAIKEKRYFYKGLKKLANKIIRILYKYLPFTKCLVKRDKIKGIDGWCSPVEEFYIRKHVRVYNLLKHSFEMRDFDYKLERSLISEYHIKIKLIAQEYDRLKNDFESNFNMITSYDFWKKYLNLQ